jgi:hypothetical protein
VPRHHRSPTGEGSLSEGMRHATLRHNQMVGELAALQVVVSSATESALGCSPNDTIHVEVVGELVTEFQKLEEWHPRLERLAMRIYDLLLGPPPDWPIVWMKP